MKIKMNNYIIISVLFFISWLFYSCTPEVNPKQKDNGNIILENSEMRLVISSNGKALSLMYKPTGEECLQVGTDISAFALTQYRPYDNELQLAYPAKVKTFPADTVYWEDGDLIVGFMPERNIATIGVKITDHYIGFTLKKFDYNFKDFRTKRKTEVDEFTLLQLPIRNRQNFGEWLNVSWDEDVAVNLLATDPYAKIDADIQKGYHIFKAGMESGVKMEGVGAALITTKKDNLLNCIDQIEQDYNLPKGVQSRRSKEYKYSYYEVWDATPDNIDEHITHAQEGGFRAIQVVCTAFASTVGHFPWKSEYSGGMKDLQLVVKKIKNAGMLAGIHFWYNKTEKTDRYVTPVPDYRLNLSRSFTLSSPLNKSSETIFVEENPDGCTMEDGRRILKIGDELIRFSSYTIEQPYKFAGCSRGEYGTYPSDYKPGCKFGLLDVDTWTKWIRFDQRTSIQQEVAERIGQIYNEAGFDFVYFDGAEDIHPPYWFYTSLSQMKVYDCLAPKPVFSEGALKSHFSWHILTRGNAFDIFKPEVFKEAIKANPFTEAELVSKDFTSINFGWVDNFPPGESTIGMQPDMFEYVCSKATAYDCPISLVGNLKQLKTHPRTADNLEVIRRWEEARINGFFSQGQKNELKNPGQEHILLVDEKGDFELQAYEPLENISGNHPIRAFIFNRKDKIYVVYWHISGYGEIEVELDAEKTCLFKEFGKEVPISESNKKIILPVGNRFFLESGQNKERVIEAFQKCKIHIK